MNKLLDILLFPKSLYNRLSDKTPAVIPGVILVGFIDLGAFFINGGFGVLYKGKSPETIAYNFVIALVTLVLIGFIDIMFFTLPLYDLFKHFKREGTRDKNARDSIVRFLKVYIVVHLWLVPIYILFFAVSGYSFTPGLTLLAYIMFFIAEALPIWLSAAITRGVNVIYNFTLLFKRFVFIIVLIWSFLLSFALEYMLKHWVMVLFK